MRRRVWQILPALTAFALAVVVLGPALRPGFALSYDLVFVPDLAVLPATVGVGSALPRAVPSDLLVALVDELVTGSLLQKLVLVGSLAAAGAGAARVLAGRPMWVRLAALALTVWNPYVAERLVIGHWVLLIAYAALPWLVLACRDWTLGVPRAAGRVVLLSAVAAVGASGGLLAAVGVVVFAAWPGRPARRHVLAVLAGVVAVNAPWVVAGLVRGDAAVSSAVGVDAFAPRAENGAGTVVTLLGGGGIWNADVVLPSRGTAVASVVTFALLLVAAVGLRSLWQVDSERSWLGPLGVWALVGIGVACVTLVPGGRAALQWTVETVPGGGLLRDGHKLVAPFVLLTAVLAPVGAQVMARRVSPGPGVGIAVVAVLLPVAALPDLAWGAGGRLEAVRYPAGWEAVRTILDDEARRDELAVSLPFQTYRAFDWNAGRPSLDPAGRYFTVPTVVDDTLVVDGVPVPGEDPFAREVGSALAEGRPLAPLGVRWLVVERSTPGEVPGTALATAELRHRGGDIELWEVVGPVAPADPVAVPLMPVVLSYVLAAVVVVGVSVRGLRRRCTVALLLFGRNSSLRAPRTKGK